jgi:hypothetical protein
VSASKAEEMERGPTLSREAAMAAPRCWFTAVETSLVREGMTWDVICVLIIDSTCALVASPTCLTRSASRFASAFDLTARSSSSFDATLISSV